ncbi:MAG TPA: type II toxin-antitoxin system VapC family toxin [Acetobacteraceae bacterium]|jgi:predicted nucleic acid-binding protein
MLVIDTNVVVRHLTNDDKAQGARARRLIEQHDVFVPLTVLLEAEWVLRSVYGLPAAAVVRALRAFAGLAHVMVESADAAAAALDWAEQGLDLADALHVAAARGYEGMASFDKALARTARRVGAPPVREP